MKSAIKVYNLVHCEIDNLQIDCQLSGWLIVRRNCQAPLHASIACEKGFGPNPMDFKWPSVKELPLKRDSVDSFHMDAVRRIATTNGGLIPGGSYTPRVFEVNHKFAFHSSLNQTTSRSFARAHLTDLQWRFSTDSTVH